MFAPRRKALAAERAALSALLEKAAKVKENGLKRAFLRADGLSQIRHVRFRQLLQRECKAVGVVVPAWVGAIAADDVLGVKTSVLVRRFVTNEGGLSEVVGADVTPAAIRRIKAAMAKLADSDRGAEQPDDLFAVHPAFNLERALALVIAGRTEFGMTNERGMSATSVICSCRPLGCAVSFAATGSKIWRRASRRGWATTVGPSLRTA